MIGNGVVVQVAETIGRLILAEIVPLVDFP